MTFIGADRFSQGRALVRVEIGDTQLYGYIGKAGSYAIVPRFIFAKSFSEGLAAVCFDARTGRKGGSEPGGNYGYIDLKGNIAIGPKYSSAGNFSEGLAAAIRL